MNSNTIVGLQAGTKRNNLLATTGLATAQTLINMGADTGTGVPAYIQVPTQTVIQGTFSPFGPNINSSLLDAGTGPATSNVYPNPPFNSGSFDGRPFRFRLSGAAVAGSGSNTITVSILQNTTPVLAGANTVATFAAGGAALAAANYNFELTANCLWDAVSQKLVVTNGGQVAGTAVVAAITTTTGITLPGTYFLASIQYVAGAANTVTPVEFAMELV